jgi:hypothetical protein
MIRHKVICTAKFKTHRINLKLRTRWRGNEMKVGYQIIKMVVVMMMMMMIIIIVIAIIIIIIDK